MHDSPSTNTTLFSHYYYRIEGLITPNAFHYEIVSVCESRHRQRRFQAHIDAFGDVFIDMMSTPRYPAKRNGVFSETEYS